MSSEIQLVEGSASPIEGSSQSALAVNSESATLMHVIEKISQMPELDMDRVERLFQMHEKMVDRQAETVYNESMSKAQMEMGAVVANKINDHTKSSFANLEAVHSACKPIWTKHGFSVSTTLSPSEQNNYILVSCEVRHAGGFKQVYKNDWPLDLAGAQGKVNKTPIQAMGSTASYARRYTELMIFDIAIKHEDNDGNQTKPAMKTLTNAQVANLRKAMDVAGVDDAYVCKMAQIDRIEELQQGRLSGAINHLKKKSQGEQLCYK